MNEQGKNVVGIVQARMGSSRLPQKILRKVKDKPLLKHMIERLLRSKYLTKVVIATTTNVLDDAIEQFALANGYLFFRGSENDVLDRFYQTSKQFQADTIARFCSDCPIIDVHYVDKIIKTYLDHDGNLDMVCNKMPFTFPDGYDTEVCSAKTIETIWREASLDSDREHVFPFLYRNAKRFSVANVEYEGGNLFNSYRFTLDYEEDFKCIEAIINELHDSNPFFGLEEVLKLVAENPQIIAINAMHLPSASVRLAIDEGHSPRDNRTVRG